MLLNKEDFKLATVERRSKNKVAANTQIWQHSVYGYQLNTSPTGNCQMSILGGINSLIFSGKDEEIIANMKTIISLTPKRMLMVDLKNHHHYVDGRIINNHTHEKFIKLFGKCIVADNPYTSTNGSKMHTILLNTQLVKEL